MIKVLHINCNYFGNNPVHRIMINEMYNLKEIDNYVFSPVYNDYNINTTEKIIALKCIRKNDRFFFHYKSYKIRKSLLINFDIETFDIIHAYTLFTDGNVAYEINKKYGIPYVVAIRNTDVNAFFKYMPHLRKRGLNIMKNAKAIFFLSKTYMDNVIDKYVPHSEKKNIIDKSYIIPNGLNDFWQKNIYNNKNIQSKMKLLNKKRVTLLYVGNIDKNKNIITTCKTIKLMTDNGWNVKFVVAGKINNKKVYAKIKDIIDYKGILSKEQLLNVYRNSDIFVMPSFTETFGIAYAEAISQGVPVVYTEGQGFDKQFDEGEVGYSVNPNDPKSIKYAIEKIIDNYELIVKELPYKINKYSWKDITREYLNIYKKALGERL